MAHQLLVANNYVQAAIRVLAVPIGAPKGPLALPDKKKPLKPKVQGVVNHVLRVHQRYAICTAWRVLVAFLRVTRESRRRLAAPTKKGAQPRRDGQTFLRFLLKVRNCTAQNFLRYSIEKPLEGSLLRPLLNGAYQLHLETSSLREHFELFKHASGTLQFWKIAD